MNTEQQEKYAHLIHLDAFAPGNDFRAPVMRRRVHCQLCSWSRTWMRGQGKSNNALAVTSRLRGYGMKHVRESHPEELEPGE